MRLFPLLLPLLLAASPVTMPVTQPAIPDRFPSFIVPGHGAEMSSLRALLHLHYQPAGPKSTLWDEWLARSTLWPAVGDSPEQRDAMRRRWNKALSDRRIDATGYVSTHQHPGLGHAEGWPFPLWTQGRGQGWHFTVKDMPYRDELGIRVTKPDGFELANVRETSLGDDGWKLTLDAGATLTTPPLSVAAEHAPWLKLNWRPTGLAGANPYIEWTTDAAPGFSPGRRTYFSAPPDSTGFATTMIPAYTIPAWSGTITRLRIGFDNPAGATAELRYLATAYDTRHNVNNANFVQGCAHYVTWTRDLDFLRRNIGRMRLAMAFVLTELGVREHKLVHTPWPGHDGRSGIRYDADGTKHLVHGQGIGNNYWDLLPFGGRDCLATIYAYDAMNRLAAIEAQVDAHPEWTIPSDPHRVSPAELRRHAEEVKAHAGKVFWNERAGRFIPSIAPDGPAPDHGLTFLNLEAVAFGFATPEQAKSITGWVAGDRVVDGDTSTGPDIYRFRFGPRATTKRNIDYYAWVWSGPETIPFGGQVQDGGAVLGFAYHDLMARLITRGPDDAWARLKETIAWFDDVQAEGGYRKYYTKENATERGTLQGGGTAGGLGMDHEFFESILVPQVMLYGFLGLAPRLDGFAIDANLPGDWPELTVTGIHLHDRVLDVGAARDGTITLRLADGPAGPIAVYPPAGQWRIEAAGTDEASATSQKTGQADGQRPIEVPLRVGGTTRLSRVR